MSSATRRCGRTTRARRRTGRLENLKELVRSMREFETLEGFLEHVSLVMDADTRRRRRPRLAHDAARRQGPGVRASCSCPAGRKGCSRTSAASTRAAAPASRRSAASPTSASPARGASAKVCFAQNRRNRGLWQAAAALALRRRAARGQRRGGRGQEPLWRLGGRRHGGAGVQPYGRSRFDEPAAGFASGYATPGWQRAKERMSREDGACARRAR